MTFRITPPFLPILIIARSVVIVKCLLDIQKFEQITPQRLYAGHLVYDKIADYADDMRTARTNSKKSAKSAKVSEVSVLAVSEMMI